MSSAELVASTEHLLDTARRSAGIDLAWVSWVDGDDQVVGVVRGDGAEHSLRTGQRITEPDALRRHRTHSYIGAPITASDGSVLGTVGCMSSSPSPAADERVVSLIAELIAR